MPAFAITPPHHANQIRFRIVAMWETKFGDRTEFAYLLEWPDEAPRRRMVGFMADTEWSESSA